MITFNKFSLLFVVLLAGLITACEDLIEVPSPFEEPQLAIDAWLTNTNVPQTIRLTETVDYFAGGTPRTVEGASIRVCKEDGSICYNFLYEGDGNYIWRPDSAQTIGTVGDAFSLAIDLEGASYSGSATINRTAVIDSIGLQFEEESLAFDEGIYGSLYARDLPGRGDTYWIRAYKNDTLLNRPEEIVVVYDATFDAGANIDGTYFIPPLRFGINPLDDDGATIPYKTGDKIYVEVHSINEAAFRFLNIASEQILNEGIFAVPVANAQSNIFNAATGKPALGIFNIAEVVSAERMVE